MIVQTELFGYPITAEANSLDDGWDVSITGGCKTHIGAVTLAAPGEQTQTLQRVQHKDAAISRVWAETLALHWQSPVCVRCGIHYDHASSDQIQEIVAACQDLLSRLMEQQ